MACEPAHIGDLTEFMPHREEAMFVGSPPDLAIRLAREALWYGGSIVLIVMRSVCQYSQLDLRAPIDELERRFTVYGEVEKEGPSDGD
jgi:hypothetical protein